jgi:MFS family permease
LAILGFAVAGLGLANMVPILFSAAGNRPGLPAGVGISTVTMVGYTGILVAPASIGFVAEHIGYRATYLTLAVLMLVLVPSNKVTEQVLAEQEPTFTCVVESRHDAVVPPLARLS